MLRSTSARALARERHRNRPSATRVRALVLQTRLGIGETGQAERLVAEMTREERGTGPVRPAVVLLPLAGDDRDAAMRVLASAVGGRFRWITRLCRATGWQRPAGTRPPARPRLTSRPHVCSVEPSLTECPKASTR